MRRLAALGCLLLTLFLTGCTGETFTPNADVKPAGSELTVWFVSDLHLLSEELTDYSSEFLAMIARGDGKTAHYSQEIGQALVWQITSLPEEERPDVLLAAGDLTFNGEKLSHETVAGLFEEIEAAGVPVLTLPGNHDVNNGMAYRYTGNTAEPTETVTAQEFREIYRAYGWEDSLLRDTASMSYVWEPAEDLWIIAIDGNTDSHSGWVDDETLTWLDKVLTQAEEEGKAVLTFSHQNLVRHNARFPFGYTFGNAMTVRELMADHGVNLNLSGHIHIQHIGEFDGLHEVTTSALSIAENHIGVVEIDPERNATYQIRELDAAGYARQAGLTSPDLLDFGTYSRDYFRENSMRTMGEKLDAMGVSEADRELMLEAAGEFNLRYFTGRTVDYQEELAALPGYALWNELPDGMGDYFAFILDSEKKDETQGDFGSLWLKGENT